MNECSTKGKCVQYAKPRIEIFEVVTEQVLAASAESKFVYSDSDIESVDSYDVFED